MNNNILFYGQVLAFPNYNFHTQFIGGVFYKPRAETKKKLQMSALFYMTFREMFLQLSVTSYLI